MATTTPTIAAPRSPHRSSRTSWEMYGWIFMRASGALLLVLIFTHLIVNLVMGGGVSQIDFGFVAGKLAKPVWQVWDLLLLWLAMIHGTNGLRVIINDYATRIGTRLVLKSALLARVHRGRRAGHPGDLHLRPLPGRRARRPAAQLLHRRLTPRASNKDE